MRPGILNESEPKSWISPLVVGFILGLVGTLLIPWVIQMINTQPDFIVTLEQPAGKAENMESIGLDVYISDDYDIYHWLHKYEYPIALIAYEMGESTLPTGLDVQFREQRFKMNGSRKVGNYMIISPTNEAKIGHSIIKISGIGGDGRERSCLYDLEVKS